MGEPKVNDSKYWPGDDKPYPGAREDALRDALAAVTKERDEAREEAERASGTLFSMLEERDNLESERDAAIARAERAEAALLLVEYAGEAGGCPRCGQGSPIHTNGCEVQDAIARKESPR